MLSAGIIIALGGAICLIYGIVQNNSLGAMLRANSEHPGLVFIIIGAVVLLIGVGMILSQVNKNKSDIGEQADIDSETESQRFCEHCHQPIDDEAKFCPKCGKEQIHKLYT